MLMTLSDDVEHVGPFFELGTILTPADVFAFGLAKTSAGTSSLQTRKCKTQKFPTKSLRLWGLAAPCGGFQISGFGKCGVVDPCQSAPRSKSKQLMWMRTKPVVQVLYCCRRLKDSREHFEILPRHVSVACTFQHNCDRYLGTPLTHQAEAPPRAAQPLQRPKPFRFHASRRVFEKAAICSSPYFELQQFHSSFREWLTCYRRPEPPPSTPPPQDVTWACIPSLDIPGTQAHRSLFSYRRTAVDRTLLEP